MKNEILKFKILLSCLQQIPDVP